MQAAGLGKVEFTLTNDTLNMTPVATIGTAVSFADGANRRKEAFKKMLISELMPSLSKGQMIVELKVKSSMITETIIQLSIDGSPPEMFVYPSYASGLYTPTNTNDDSLSMASSMSGLFDVMDLNNTYQHPKEYQDEGVFNANYDESILDANQSNGYGGAEGLMPDTDSWTNHSFDVFAVE